MKALYVDLDLKEEFYQFQTQKSCPFFFLPATHANLQLLMAAQL